MELVKGRKLKKICYHLQCEIDKAIDTLISECRVEYDIEGIAGCITDSVVGRAKFDGRFTVPLWAYDKRFKGKNYRGEEGYFIYYVAHELAHQLRYKKYGMDGVHDYKFYEIFKEICPNYLQHFELNYIKTSRKYGIK